jgi:hypothetical protein
MVVFTPGCCGSVVVIVFTLWCLLQLALHHGQPSWWSSIMVMSWPLCSLCIRIVVSVVVGFTSVMVVQHHGYGPIWLSGLHCTTHAAEHLEGFTVPHVFLQDS